MEENKLDNDLENVDQNEQNDEDSGGDSGDRKILRTEVSQTLRLKKPFCKKSEKWQFFKRVKSLGLH